MARIELVHGGMGYTRDVSLQAAHHVGAALRHLGHDVVDVDADGIWSDPILQADVVVSLLLGYEGEEGHLPAVCEAAGVPFLGSDAATSQLCGNKTLMKQRLVAVGVPTPGWHAMTAEAVRRYAGMDALRRAADRLGYPVIVKPVVQSQGVGVHLVEAPDDLAVAVRAAFAHGDAVLVEQYVHGTEIAVCLLGSDLEPLPLVGIRLSGRRLFDIDARSLASGVEYVIPAKIPSAAATAARETAAAAARALGLRDIGRVDVVVGADGPVVLDVTPCPGLSETSATSQAAAAAGIDYEALVDRLITTVLQRTGQATVGTRRRAVARR